MRQRTSQKTLNLETLQVLVPQRFTLGPWKKAEGVSLRFISAVDHETPLFEFNFTSLNGSSFPVSKFANFLSELTLLIQQRNDEDGDRWFKGEQVELAERIDDLVTVAYRKAELLIPVETVRARFNWLSNDLRLYRDSLPAEN